MEIQRIVAAALVVLERSGWQGLKIDRVLGEAGLSTRSFYRHFQSKNELLVVLLEEEVAAIVASAERSSPEDDEPQGRVRHWIETIVNRAHDEATAGRTRYFLSRWSVLEHEFAGDVGHCRSMMVAPLREIIEDGQRQRRGVFPLAEPEQDAMAIHSIIVGRMVEPTSEAEQPCPGEVAGFAIRALTGVDAAEPKDIGRMSVT